MTVFYHSSPTTVFKLDLLTAIFNITCYHINYLKYTNKNLLNIWNQILSTYLFLVLLTFHNIDPFTLIIHNLLQCFIINLSLTTNRQTSSTYIISLKYYEYNMRNFKYISELLFYHNVLSFITYCLSQLQARTCLVSNKWTTLIHCPLENSINEKQVANLRPLVCWLIRLFKQIYIVERFIFKCFLLNKCSDFTQNLFKVW